MHHDLHTEVDIDASPEAVWSVLTNLGDYPDWNPFVTSAEGTVEVGQRLINRLEPPNGKAMTIKPTVTVVESGQTFEWLGHLGVPGVFDGRHRFELEPNADGGTRFVHSEHFNGVLVRLLRKTLDGQTQQGFVAMNDAIKARAEIAARSES